MSTARMPLPSKVCRKCERELPATDEYFQPRTWHGLGPDTPHLLGTCRRCRNGQVRARRAEKTQIAQSVARVTGNPRWQPRVSGEGGVEGGFTEYPEDGYRFLCVPDSHGDLIDWAAADALLAFVRFYRPVRVFLLGDHVDFAAFSRFESPPSDIDRIEADKAACRKFLGLVRESAPEARITYLKGNHEQRFNRFLWKNQIAAKMLGSKNVPEYIGISDFNIEWEESGTLLVNDRLMVKHGHMVRQRAGYTGHGELERNGITGISGHTHRLGQIYKRNRTGLMTWVESGCICKYDPDYMEGQVSEWAQGLSFGTVSLKGHGFAVHTAPIIKGRVRSAFAEIGP